MRPCVPLLLALAACLPAAAGAQAPVPVASEPHHHLVYISERLRVFRVEVPAHDSTLVHAHTVDYFWIAVGGAEFVNAVAGKAAAKVKALDGSVHFTRGGFAHAARVEGGRPFHNVTLELPQQQTNPRNLCEAAVAGEPLDCAAATKRAAETFVGSGVRPAFSTDQVRVTLLTIAPGATLQVTPLAREPLLVTVDPANATVQMTCREANGAKVVALRAHSGDVFPIASSTPCRLHNSAAEATRFLAVEFMPAARARR